MTVPILPHAIEWIGKDLAGFLLMYHVTRGIPMLFEKKYQVERCEREWKESAKIMKSLRFVCSRFNYDVWSMIVGKL
jgi:hypothetical protein